MARTLTAEALLDHEPRFGAVYPEGLHFPCNVGEETLRFSRLNVGMIAEALLTDQAFTSYECAEEGAESLYSTVHVFALHRLSEEKDVARRAYGRAEGAPLVAYRAAMSRASCREEEAGAERAFLGAITEAREARDARVATAYTVYDEDMAAAQAAHRGALAVALLVLLNDERNW